MEFELVNEKPFYGSTQIQSPNELILGEKYTWHFAWIRENGQKVQNSGPIKYIGTNGDDEGPIFIWWDADIDANIRRFDLAELGLAPTPEGRWIKDAWLEDRRRGVIRQVYELLDTI